jgi:hypothetical protein
MKRYAANPQKSKSLPGPSNPKSDQLTSELYRLTGKITPFDAKEFQTMSDKQGAEHIAMHLLVDDEARFTIRSTFKAKAPYLNLPTGWENWETNWSTVARLPISRYR